MLVKDEVSYHTAYELLEKGSEVHCDEFCCLIQAGLICIKVGHEVFQVPYHSTFHHVYDVVDDFKPKGLHDNMVQVDVYGVTVYQSKGTERVYYISAEGNLRHNESSCILSRINYEGDAHTSDITITVDSEGNVSRKTFLEMWSNEYD